MKDIPTKREFEWSPQNSMKKFDPYTVVFVYPRGDKPFRIKGGLHDVENWLEFYENESSFFYHKVFYGENPNKINFSRRRLRSNVNPPNAFHKYYGGHIMSERYRVFVSVQSLKTIKGKKSRQHVRVQVFDKKGGFLIGKSSGDDRIYFSCRRPPRCFPKQLLPYCDDHVNEEFLKNGLRKRNV